MDDRYLNLLHEYWGYDRFRGIQRDIIESIGSGRDTLGLMPTGGGKSITFQVPALARPGVCLVVTPLIALMKDQVAQLRRRGIKAAALYTGLSREEIVVLLENCIYGDYKFLYVSPERLSSPLFLAKLPHMPVSFLTVDEAHCISQWGYDFRPSYTRIADIRRLLPDCPVLALSTLYQPDVSLFYPYLSGQRTVLAGPSGVGKSSLLNLLLPEENAQTAEVSARLQRDRHTTRYVRLLPLPGDAKGGMLADTPGFFVLDAPRELTADTLAQHYPDFNRIMQHAGGCRFDGCRHDREPDCAVKAAVEAGALDAGRYQRYIRILHEITEREVKY